MILILLVLACQNQNKIEEEKIKEIQLVWFVNQKNAFEEEIKKISNIKLKIASLDENDEKNDLNITLAESQRNCKEIADRYNASAFYFDIENLEIEKCM